MKLDGNEIVQKVRRRILHELPVATRQVNIPKKSGGSRVLGIGSILDRIAQQCILNVLIPITESKFSNNSYGFRLDTSTKHALSNFINPLWKGKGEWFVINIDLDSYFDRINRELVIDKLRDEFDIDDAHFLSLIKKFVYTPVMEDGEIRHRTHGLPQGGILSPTLSNVYLHELDIKMDDIISKNEKYDKHLRRFIKRGTIQDNIDGPYIRYTRYADDMRIIVPCEYMVHQVIDMVDEYCRNIDLVVNREKTEYYSLSKRKSVEFVGFKVNKKENGITISVSDPLEFKRRVKEAYKVSVKSGNYSFFKSIMASSISYMDITTNMNWYFKYIETLIHQRHRNSKSNGITMKLVNGNRKYYIDGEYLPLREIRSQTNTSISKFLRSPFRKEFGVDRDNIWNDATKFINTNNNYSSRLIMYLPGLLHRQKFKCYVTKEPLLPQYCDIHHKTPLSKGGTDEFNNLVVIGRNVHKQLHGLEPKDTKISNTRNFKILENKL